MRVAVPRPFSPDTIAPADDAVLKALLRFHYLASRQVCRLSYSPRSLTYVQSKLKRLTDLGYCQRIWLPRPAPHGSAPSLYTLARKGLNYLRAQGIDVPQRYHPSEQREHSYLAISSSTLAAPSPPCRLRRSVRT